MRTAENGATGRIGSEVVRGLLARQQPVTALVRNAARARQMFGPAENLDIRKTDLGPPRRGRGRARRLRHGVPCHRVGRDRGQPPACRHPGRRRGRGDATRPVLTDPETWGTHHDLTGPRLLASPEAMRLLSGELGEQVSFVTATEREFLRRLTSLGVPAGQAELLITREWALLAGENERTTSTVRT